MGRVGQPGQVPEHRAATGLIIGRFDPPHLGHSFLVEEAAGRCERLVVFVNSSSSRDAAPGHLRAEWLAEMHPNVTVVEVVHDLPTDWGDEQLWQRWITLFRDHWPHETGPHVVCSSDPYVAELARRLGAEPVVVDADRVNVPISATMVRTDPAAHLEMLAPTVRAWVEANWL
jgi:cytidyltransferase-like protein